MSFLYSSYIVTFDKELLDYLGGSNKLHDRLTNARGVINWWHYLDSTYILIVENTYNATSISNLISKIAPDRRFFVAQINLKDHNGWLPKEAWDWIKDQRV